MTRTIKSHSMTEYENMHSFWKLQPSVLTSDFSSAQFGSKRAQNCNVQYRVKLGHAIS